MNSAEQRPATRRGLLALAEAPHVRGAHVLPSKSSAAARGVAEAARADIGAVDVEAQQAVPLQEVEPGQVPSRRKAMSGAALPDRRTCRASAAPGPSMSPASRSSRASTTNPFSAEPSAGRRARPAPALDACVPPRVDD